MIEIRKPWAGDPLHGMVIAVDPGHGGSDNGAVGPHGSRGKRSQPSASPRLVKDLLEKAGAKPFLIRNTIWTFPFTIARASPGKIRPGYM